MNFLRKTEWCFKINVCYSELDTAFFVFYKHFYMLIIVYKNIEILSVKGANVLNFIYFYNLMLQKKYIPMHFSGNKKDETFIFVKIVSCLFRTILIKRINLRN